MAKNNLSFYQKLSRQRLTTMRYVFAVLLTFTPYLFFVSIVINIDNGGDDLAIFGFIALLPLIPWGVSMALFYKRDRYLRPFLLYLLCSFVVVIIAIVIAKLVFISHEDILETAFIVGSFGGAGVVSVSIGIIICIFFFKKKWYAQALVCGCILFWGGILFLLGMITRYEEFDVSTTYREVLLFGATVIVLSAGIIVVIHTRRYNYIIAGAAILFALTLMSQSFFAQQQLLRWYVDDVCLEVSGPSDYWHGEDGEIDVRYVVKKSVVCLRVETAQQIYTSQLDGADAETFDRMEYNSYAKDRNNVYYNGQIVNDADTASFEQIEGSEKYYKDHSHVYWHGRAVTDFKSEKDLFVVDLRDKDEEVLVDGERTFYRGKIYEKKNEVNFDQDHFTLQFYEGVFGTVAVEDRDNAECLTRRYRLSLPKYTIDKKTTGGVFFVDTFNQDCVRSWKDERTEITRTTFAGRNVQTFLLGEQNPQRNYTFTSGGRNFVVWYPENYATVLLPQIILQ